MRQRHIRLDPQGVQLRELNEAFDEFDDPRARHAACKKQRANGGFPVPGALPLSPGLGQCTDEPPVCRCSLSYYGLACNLGIGGGLSSTSGSEKVRTRRGQSRSVVAPSSRA